MSNDTLKRYLYITSLMVVLLVLLLAVVNFIARVHIAAELLALSILLAYVLVPVVHFFEAPMYLYIPPEYNPRVGFGKYSRSFRIKLGETRRVVRITRQGMPRWAAITATYVLMALILVIALAYLIPVIQQQTTQLVGNLDELVAGVQQAINKSLLWLKNTAPPAARPYLERIDPNMIRMDEVLRQAQNMAPGVMKGTFTGLFTFTKTAAHIFAAIFLVPLFAFYLLLDSDRYYRGFMAMVPPNRKSDVAALLHEIDYILGRYIRGQLLVCITIGTSIAVALNMLGVEYATLIGVFAGIIDFVPYAGVALGMIPAFFITLANHGLAWAFIVLFVMWLIHQVEGHIIVPAVLGHSVNLPPLVVVLALLAGAQLAGIMGMFCAIPIAAILKVLGGFYVRKMEEAHGIPPAAAEVKADATVETPAPDGGVAAPVSAPSPGPASPAATAGSPT